MTEFLRSTTGRLLITLCLGVGSLVLGIVAANALGGSAPVEVAEDEAVVVGSIPEPTGAFVDIVAPVLSISAEDLAADDGSFQQVVDDSTGTASSATSPIVGSAADPTPGPADTPNGGEAAESVETTTTTSRPPDGELLPEGFDLFLDYGFLAAWSGDLLPLILLAVDPCAGSEPGSGGSGCSEGVGATVLVGSQSFASEAVPPAPQGSIRADSYQVRGAQPTIQSCPQGFPARHPLDYPVGDRNEFGLSTVGLYTTTPLESAELRFQPIAGTLDEGGYIQAIDPAAHEGYTDGWNEILESLGSSNVMFCRNIGRHPLVTYHVEGTAVDAYDRSFELEPAVLTAATPDGRPLTIASRSGETNRFMIEGWTKSGGHVRLVDGSCDFGFASATTGRSEAFEEASWVVTDVAPRPVGYADPAYSERWRWYSTVDIGESRTICAYVYASDDPFDILGADELILESTKELVARVYLERLIIERGNIAPGELAIEFDGIGAGIYQARPSGPQGSILLFEDLLYDGSVFGRGIPEIVFTQEYTDSRTNRTGRISDQYRIPFDPFPECDEGPCGEGTDYFHFALPGTLMESSSFAGGFITIRVEKEFIGGTTSSLAGWRYGGADQQADESAFAFSMEFDRPATDPETLRKSVDATVFTPGPREITAIRYRPSHSNTACVGGTIPVDRGGPTTEVNVRVEQLCPGTPYDFDVEYVASDGVTRWLPVVAIYTPNAVVGRLEVSLELESAGRLRSAVEDVTVTVETFTRILGSGCLEPNREFDVLERQMGIYGDTLDITVTFDNPTAGNGCADAPSRNPQPLRATFSIPIAQLSGCEANAGSAVDTLTVGTANPIDVTIRAQVCIPELPAIGSTSFAAEG